MESFYQKNCSEQKEKIKSELSALIKRYEENETFGMFLSFCNEDHFVQQVYQHINI